MVEPLATPVFTGAELALADTLVLLIDVLMAHKVLDRKEVDTVLTRLGEEYDRKKLVSSAGMAGYLRRHAADLKRDHHLVVLRDILCGRDGRDAGRA